MKAPTTMLDLARREAMHKGVRTTDDGRNGWFLDVEELRTIYNSQGFVALPGRGILQRHVATWEQQGLAVAEGDLVGEAGGRVWMKVDLSDVAMTLAVERAGADTARTVVV